MISSTGSPWIGYKRTIFIRYIKVTACSLISLYIPCVCVCVCSLALLLACGHFKQTTKVLTGVLEV